MKINQSRRRTNNNNVRKINSSNHTFDSQGPDGKIRGTANQIFEKYMALARDATSSGDRISAEYFYQYADHYYRITHPDNENEGSSWHEEDRRYSKNRSSGMHSPKPETEETVLPLQNTSEIVDHSGDSADSPRITPHSEGLQNNREGRFENRKSRHPYLGGNTRSNSERPRRASNRPLKSYATETSTEEANFSRPKSDDQDVITVIQ